MEPEIWKFILDQGAIVTAFALGALGSFRYTRIVQVDRMALEKERYMHIKKQLDQLSQDLRVSEERCDAKMRDAENRHDAKIVALEEKYRQDLNLIKDINDSSERRMMSMIGMVSGRRAIDKKETGINSPSNN